MAEFQVPEFLEDQDIDTIHERMLENLPDDIDVSVGSHPYNLTRPVAYIISYMLESVLADAIMLMFPKYCEDFDEILDDHAEIRGMSRKPAQYATGYVTVTGDEGTVIPMGEIFETVSSNDDEEAVVEFEAIAAATIPAAGYVNVDIMAVEPGLEGNVAANTIIMFDIEDVSNVTNPEATSGGMDEESNEELQERIVNYDLNIGNSFVGSVTDYKRWAEEVNGVGNAAVISPTDGGDPIRIILTDTDGAPVSLAVQTDVYDHIMGVEADGSDRLAPVNATIQVETPTQTNLYISATVVLNTAYALDSLPTIKQDFADSLKEYLTEAPGEGKIKYSTVCRYLSETDGIFDFTGLQMKITGGSMASTNITIDDSDSIAILTDNISFTVVTQDNLYS